MKQLARVFSLFILMAMTAIHSAAQTAALELTAADSITFTCSLTDGPSSDTVPTNYFLAENLKPGRYTIHLNFTTPGVGTLESQVYLRKDLKITYAVKVKDRTGSQFTYALSLRGESKVIVVPEMTYGEPHPELVDSIQLDSLPIDTVQIDSLTGLPVYNGTKGCDTPLPASAFDVWYDDLKDMTFERQRRSSILETLEIRCLTTQQVLQLLYLFEFEDYRMEVAQAAYPHTYDQANYSDLKAAFVLRRHKDDLQDFVATYGGDE